MLPSTSGAARPRPASLDSAAADIVALGTAQPPYVLSQPQALAYGLELVPMSDRTRHLFSRVMSADGIETRHIGIEEITDLLDTNHEHKLARFEKWGVELSSLALRRALDAAGTPPDQLDYLAVTTCTGYLCPGLSAYVAESCGLRPDIRRADLVGMGCGAAMPALEQAAAFLAAHPDGTAATISTEVCSAAMLLGDAPDLIVSNAIFGDGSAAAVLRAPEAGAVTAAEAQHGNGPDGHGLRPRILAFKSHIVPEWRDCLRFRTEGGHLRNVLTREVPVRAGEACRQLVVRLLEERALTVPDIEHWIVHPGGRTVLDAVERALELPQAALASARHVLKTSGNMSSPSVLFVLQHELRTRTPRPGALGIVTAFGAGFAAHAALVEFAEDR